MAKSNPVKQRKRGPAPTGVNPIMGFRPLPSLRVAITSHAKAEGISISDAIRRLVELGLSEEASRARRSTNSLSDAGLSITKLDAAEREIVAAVQLLFAGGDPIAVYTLANAAREITSTLCEKRGKRSVVDAIQEDRPELSRKEIYRLASEHASFFKHADRDPDAILQHFDPTEADAVLWVACHDLGSLTGRKPVEADVFELWFLATRDLLKALGLGEIKELLGVTTSPRERQIAIGRSFLEAACAEMAHRVISPAPKLKGKVK